MSNEKINITLAGLKAKGACYWRRRGLTETAKRIEENLPATLHEIMCWDWVSVADREWVFKEFATAPELENYKQARAITTEAWRQETASAHRAYEQAKATAWEAYEQAKATALEAYMHAIEPALMEHSK